MSCFLFTAVFWWWITVFVSIISSKKKNYLKVLLYNKYHKPLVQSTAAAGMKLFGEIKHCKPWPMSTHSKRELFSTAGTLPEVPSALESATSWAETFWVKNSASKYYACTKFRSWLLWLRFKLLKWFLALSYSSHGQKAPIVCQN